jgi:hypothetical protein
MNYSDEIIDVTEQRDSGELFDQLGIEADFVEENTDGISIPNNYNLTKLSEAYDGDYLQGKPYLSDISEYTFEDKDTGEKKTNYSVRLVLIDEDDEEAYEVKINLKSPDIIQTNVHKASKLYALVVGLINMKSEGAFQNYNHLKKVNLENIQQVVNSIDDMTLKVEEIRTNNFSYNTFKVVNG